MYRAQNLFLNFAPISSQSSLADVKKTNELDRIFAKIFDHNIDMDEILECDLYSFSVKLNPKMADHEKQILSAKILILY